MLSKGGISEFKGCIGGFDNGVPDFERGCCDALLLMEPNSLGVVGDIGDELGACNGNGGTDPETPLPFLFVGLKDGFGRLCKNSIESSDISTSSSNQGTESSKSSKCERGLVKGFGVTEFGVLNMVEGGEVKSPNGFDGFTLEFEGDNGVGPDESIG